MDEMIGKFYRQVLKPRLYACWIYYIHWSQIPVFFLFLIIRWLWLQVDTIRLRALGLHEHLQAVKRGERFSTSAHVCKIHLYCRAIPTDKVRASQFITTHHGFEHPDTVLRDNVILVDVDTDGALFLEMPDSVERFTANRATFQWNTVGHEALRLIWMPLESFYKIAEQIGDPAERNHRVTFFFNSGRCGSTLVAKIVDHADPGSLVLSEPPVLMSLYCLKQQVRAGRFARLVRCSLYVMLKPTANDNKQRYVVKPIFFVTNIAADIHGALQSAHCYFVHRRPLKTILAHERAFAPTLFFRLIQLTFYCKRWEQGERYIGFHREPTIARRANEILKPTMFETCCVIFADNMVRYLRQAEQFPFPSFLYDQVFDNLQSFCVEVLRMCGAPADQCLPAALQCAQSDSQDNTIFSQAMLKQCAFSQVTPEMTARIEQFFQILNLPPLVEPTNNCPPTVDGPSASKKQKPTAILGRLAQPNANKTTSDYTSPTKMIKPLPVQCMISPSDNRAPAHFYVCLSLPLVLLYPRPTLATCCRPFHHIRCPYCYYLSIS
ncbi:Cytochrome c oxidase subunit [Trichinella spiralis]|uniref:Cytochrome c oxidase subunit n=1 Tax=Trichinella spiralis TaxID=6334 RepID=A0ABR3KCI4_TRISP